MGFQIFIQVFYKSILFCDEDRDRLLVFSTGVFAGVTPGFPTLDRLLTAAGLLSSDEYFKINFPFI